MKLNLPLFIKDINIKNSKKIKLSSTHLSIAIASSKGRKELDLALKNILAPWQKAKIKDQMSGSYSFETTKGPFNLILIPDEDYENIHHEGLISESQYAIARDQLGKIVCRPSFKEFSSIGLYFFNTEYDEIIGSLVGLEMGSYNYKSQSRTPELNLSYIGELPKKAIENAIHSASSIGKGVNIARFLVDTPPSDKRPESYAQSVLKLFEKKSDIKIAVWDEKRLKKENMGMLLAVGQASVQLPRLVHLKYRPKKARDMAPVAFVGKGITFDTGGLNLKPGGSMRNMKKDMGGSAALVGLAYWVSDSNLDIPCDFYLALAENSIDAHSFRPGDVLKARNGMTVEIDNTDAEGRLALGDALCIASEKQGKDRPQFLIDIATLTGAIKVGLGSDIAGLFSNDDELAFILQSCSQISGDKAWRMPLLPSQRKKLKSDIADITNSSSGFGGAIRAAKFLQEFTGDLPWAHFDIYAWNDSANGPYGASGGNGQGVQCLAQFLSQL